MKILQSLSVLIAISLTGIAPVSAAGWFSFSTSSDSVPVYCQGDECSLQKGVDATKTAVGDHITSRPLSEYAQDIVSYFLTFVSIVAVLYIIYGGFVVMIGAGDEEKMKKMKNIILYVIVGILIMWLSYGIVKWVINLVGPTAWGGQQQNQITWSLVPEVSAYTESDADTFQDYQGQIRVAIQNLEAELRVNGKVATTSIQNIKSLVQAAYDRLPDTGESATENSTAKRAVDMYLDIAAKSPNSTQKVGEAISKTSAFLEGAKISRITGEISATPSEGNAPLTVSFLATDVVDPSGTTPGSNNYIWWTRENGGVRREIGRGASLMYTFNQEGTFTVNLDVISGSRNSKGKTDVLPLSISKSISVKPKLGEIILLINGVNVSNIDSIKLNPTIGKMGVILDATASRAIGNGSITKTSWKFGNGNEMNYSGKPIVERQIYGNQGSYDLELQIETNDGKKVSKKLQIIVRDPSAVIKLEDDVVHVGEVAHISALSYFASTNNNVEYSWQIQNDDNQKVLKSAAGKNLDYTFDTIGTYIVTLNARSPNGNIDSDSKTITVESREPIASLDTPSPLSKERPNTIVFDASKSYDPDTKSSEGLTYTWRVDGQKVELMGKNSDGSRGTLSFDTVGDHTASVTVANAFGKVSTTEKNFRVDSTLSVEILATPQVAPIGTPMNFIARSENASFYEWNFGDGSPSVSGSDKIVSHVFKKTGNYTINLTVTSKQGGKSNQAQKKIYVTDTNSPFAIIDVSNSSSSAYEDSSVCGSGAIVVNRAEATNLSAARSINIDGSNNNLTYTWNYFGKVKTTQMLSEKFGDLGCFPVKLTVRSSKNGATSSTTQFLYLKNQAPEFTNITSSIDTSKKDSQKVLVKVTANGAKDPDGVITSYIWYYTTESDKEPQNVQITQKPEITFILPNITEKYYFGVILEDNDGARTNSADDTNEQTPLILTNQNGNIYLPLITLSTPKSSIIAGESVHLSVTAKTIIGTDITNKSEYAWDFDGDGKIDQKTQVPSVDYIYGNSGNYTVKVRVTYNGVSNTKYQTIYVKNELKAQAHGYKLANGSYYLLNSSAGIYDKAIWKYQGGSIESLYSVVVDANTPVIDGALAILSVSNGGADISTAPILINTIEDISSSGGVAYQSSPRSENDVIHIKGPSEKLILSMIGNNASHYAIDTDITIDSNLDGIPDNDVDNQDLPSYSDGSVFVMKDFNGTRNREQKIKITLIEGSAPVASRIITLILDYIPETTSGTELVSLSSGGLNDFDRAKLDELAGLIRSVDDTNRIVLMKTYNTLVENWEDTFAKSKTLIDLQSVVDGSSIDADKKTAITTVINDLLSGESESTNDIALSAKLIKGLVSNSPNASILEEKLAAIESHPQSFDENLILAKEVFDIVQSDSSLDDDTKKYIYNQLSVIKSGGTQNVPPETIETSSSSSGSGILGFIGGVVKVFFLIIGITLVVILIGYIVYRISRKNEAIGFQDFLIDSVFHARKGGPDNSTISTTTPKPVSNEQIGENKPSVAIVSTDVLITQEKEIAPVIDPMTIFEQSSPATPPPVPKIPVSAPESLSINNPDTVNEVKKDEVTTLPETEEKAIPTSEGTSENTQTEEINSSIPDWLKMPEEGVPNVPAEQETVEDSSQPAFVPASDVPDWLKSTSQGEEEGQEKDISSEVAPTTDESFIPNDILGTESEDTNITENSETTTNATNAPAEGIPDWLVSSVTPSPNETSTKEDSVSKSPTDEKQKKTTGTKKSGGAKKLQEKETKNTQAPVPNNIPDWLK